jgi:hypothetical protein
LQYAKATYKTALITWLFFKWRFTGSVYKPAEGLENTITYKRLHIPSSKQKDIQAMAQSTEAYQKCCNPVKWLF